MRGPGSVRWLELRQVPWNSHQTPLLLSSFESHNGMFSCPLAVMAGNQDKFSWDQVEPRFSGALQTLDGLPGALHQ